MIEEFWIEKKEGITVVLTNYGDNIYYSGKNALNV